MDRNQPAEADLEGCGLDAQKHFPFPEHGSRAFGLVRGSPCRRGACPAGDVQHDPGRDRQSRARYDRRQSARSRAPARRDREYPQCDPREQLRRPRLLRFRWPSAGLRAPAGAGATDGGAPSAGGADGRESAAPGATSRRLSALWLRRCPAPTARRDLCPAANRHFRAFLRLQCDRRSASGELIRNRCRA